LGGNKGSIKGEIMRCKACNVALDDIESTRKDKQTGEYLDLCGKCLYGYEDEETVDTGDFYVDVDSYVKGWEDFGGDYDIDT
jgi:hypothetical protein